MPLRVDVEPALYRWAIDRSRADAGELQRKFPKLSDWQAGEASPTFKQLEDLEDFAKATRAPVGYFFLPEPPEERLPVADFRTVADTSQARPSPDLLDTLHMMQRRQAWLREALVAEEADPLVFAGSARLTDEPTAVGHEMRRALGLEGGWASEVRSWQDAVSELRRAIERLGVMAVINGVVGNNTHRPLSVEEFRGFALADPHAPLIFVNGADAKSAQMFTLAHELAHIWLGEAGLSGFEFLLPGGTDVEDWCNQAAAEFLAPALEVRARWEETKRAADRFGALARVFKVSPVVAARRTLDLGLISRSEFFDFYQDYVGSERGRGAVSGGGDFCNNQNTRVGELFATHVLHAAMEGRMRPVRRAARQHLLGAPVRERPLRLHGPLITAADLPTPTASPQAVARPSGRPGSPPMTASPPGLTAACRVPQSARAWPGAALR